MGETSFGREDCVIFLIADLADIVGQLFKEANLYMQFAIVVNSELALVTNFYVCQLPAICII